MRHFEAMVIFTSIVAFLFGIGIWFFILFTLMKSLTKECPHSIAKCAGKQTSQVITDFEKGFRGEK